MGNLNAHVNRNTARSQKQFVCTKRSGVGFVQVEGFACSCKSLCSFLHSKLDGFNSVAKSAFDNSALDRMRYVTLQPTLCFKYLKYLNIIQCECHVEVICLIKL